MQQIAHYTLGWSTKRDQRCQHVFGSKVLRTKGRLRTRTFLGWFSFELGMKIKLINCFIEKSLVLLLSSYWKDCPAVVPWSTIVNAFGPKNVIRFVHWTLSMWANWWVLLNEPLFRLQLPIITKRVCDVSTCQEQFPMVCQHQNWITYPLRNLVLHTLHTYLCTKSTRSPNRKWTIW